MGEDRLDYILRDLANHIERLETKLDAQSELTAALAENVRILSENVAQIQKILVIGNGQPALVQQVQDLYHRMDNHTQRLNKCPVLSREMDETSLKKAKASLYAKIAGVIALAIPGLAALIQVLTDST